MDHYFVKLVIVLAVLFCINRVMEVKLVLPWSGTARIPGWLLMLVRIFEAEGWTVIPAMILAGIWQIAERS